jgi:hypothetical protein
MTWFLFPAVNPQSEINLKKYWDHGTIKRQEKQL